MKPRDYQEDPSIGNSTLDSIKQAEKEVGGSMEEPNVLESLRRAE